MTISGRTPSQKNNRRLNSNAIATSSIVGLHIHQFQHLNTPRTIIDLLWVVHFTYRIFSNLIRIRFCRFLKRKKKLRRGSNPHLSFNRPLPTRQTD